MDTSEQDTMSYCEDTRGWSEDGKYLLLIQQTVCNITAIDKDLMHYHTISYKKFQHPILANFIILSITFSSNFSLVISYFIKFDNYDKILMFLLKEFVT